MLRAVAAGVGCSYTQVSSDFSSSNYSSSRLELLETRAHYRTLQQYLIDNLCQPIYERWMEMAVMSGAVRAPGFDIDPDRYYESKWIAPAAQFVDPQKEAEAYKSLVRSGIMTLSQVIALHGGDFEETMRQRQHELATLDELGIVTDTDPSEVTKAGQAKVLLSHQLSILSCTKKEKRLMANVNGTDINLTPTDGMKTEAERYRKWKSDGEAGGTEVAARRATQILSGDELSPDVVVEMSAWFARHLVDKKGQGFSPDEDGYPSKGRVAWAAWGGDAGQSWSSEKSASIKKARERSMTDEQRAEPGDLKVGDFVSWNSSGGRARGRIDRVVRDGTIDVPDSSFTITGTEDDPAALITLYRDGEATDRKVGHKFSTLTRLLLFACLTRHR